MPNGYSRFNNRVVNVGKLRHIFIVTCSHKVPVLSFMRIRYIQGEMMLRSVMLTLSRGYSKSRDMSSKFRHSYLIAGTPPITPAVSFFISAKANGRQDELRSQGLNKVLHCSATPSLQLRSSLSEFQDSCSAIQVSRPIISSECPCPDP